MMKRFLGFMFFLILFLNSCSNNQTYNDIESVESKISKELDIRQVSVFGLKDIEEYRFIGYKYNNSHGYAVFSQNENGDYNFDCVTKADKMIPRALDIKIHYYGDYWIAVINNNNLKTISFTIDDEETFDIEITDYPSICVIKLPYEDYFETAEYNFYDSEGVLIK